MFNPRSFFQKYRDYVLLNRTLVVSIASAMIGSAIFSQLIKEQSGYVNASLTIGFSYLLYYAVFAVLYYRDNRDKYISEAGGVDTKKFRRDFVKLLASVGIAEVIYFSTRWVLHYYLLESGYEPFFVSLSAHLVAASVFVLAVNAGVFATKLYKRS